MSNSVNMIFKTLSAVQKSNGLLTAPEQAVTITDKNTGGLFKTIRKGSKTVDGGVVVKGDRKYDLERVYHNNEVHLSWYNLVVNGVVDTTRLAAALTYCADNGEYLVPTKREYDLGGANIILPVGLKIKSADGWFSNGTLTGSNAVVEAHEQHPLFAPSIVFAGAWVGGSLTPQNFGAATNKDNTIFANDCSTSLQAIIDSPFHVNFTAGFYYTAATTFVKTAKTVTMVRGMIPGENRENGFTPVLKPDHTRIYTDQNIDVFTIQAENVSFSGRGVIDCTKVPSHTKAAFRYDLNYRIWSTSVDAIVLGNESSLPTNGIGTTAFFVDKTSITVDNGFLCYAMFRGYIRGCKHGLYVSPLTNTAMSTFTTSIWAEFDWDYCKQAFLNTGSSETYYKGTGQARAVLAEEEKDLRPVEASGAVIDFFCWDVSVFDGKVSAPYGNGNGKSPIKDLGGCSLVGRSVMHAKNGFIEYTKGIPYNGFPIVNPPEVILPKTHYGGARHMISEMHNQFAAADKRWPTTIKAYAGTTYDFDTNLGPSTTLTETANISIERPENLFKTKPSEPMKYTFLTGADLAKDFIEIVIDLGNGTAFGQSFHQFLLWLEFTNGNSTNRIQIIETYGDGTTKVHNLYPDTPINYNRQLFRVKDLGIITKFIVRLIGADKIDSGNQILDFCGGRVLPTISPFLTIDGGQRVYGDLTTEQYRLSDLNVAPTTATDIGTKGEIRVTATHIYVCTAANTWVRTALATW